MKSIIVIIFSCQKENVLHTTAKEVFVGGFILFHLVLFFTHWGLDPNLNLEKECCGQKKSALQVRQAQGLG